MTTISGKTAKKLSTTATSSRSSLRQLTSLVSLTFVVVLLTSVVTWHGNLPKTIEQVQKKLTRRWLEADIRGNEGEDGPGFDDDQTRTQKCKEYLMNFLNGTTDANDQCQGFYNAYQAADCKDDTNAVIFPYGDTDSGIDENGDDDPNKKNDTSTDDDVMIDDFFENWECCDSIQNFYEKNCEQRSELHSVRLLGIMLVLLVCTILKAMTKRMQIHWLPDACVFILVGALVGGILRVVDQGLVQNKLSFDNDLFLQILLPPIIFQAALSIDKRAFRRDLFPILAFAGLGTAFSAIAIGIITYHVSKWGSNAIHLPLLDSLVFGALISSIDPVATLSILSGVGVSQTDTLYTLIFGESLLNDGVAIVLFDTLKSHLGDEDALQNPHAYKDMAMNFCGVLFGSIGIGIGVGIACTIYFYCLRGRQSAVTEVMIFFCWALIPYYIADGLGCSGIIAIMVMGFIMDYYVIGGFQSDETAWMDYIAERGNNTNGGSGSNGPAAGMQQQQQHHYPQDHLRQLQDSVCKAFSGRGHILSRSRHHVGFVAEVIATLMDTSIFAYLGLFLFNGDELWSFRLNMTSILSCVSSRFVMVVGLSFIINLAVFFDLENLLARLFLACRRGLNLSNSNDDDSITSESRAYLDKKTQLILLLAGVRGAVSFALVENVPVWDTVQQSGSKYKAELKAMTSSAIVFTLFVFGALTYITVKAGSGSGGGGSSGDPISGGHVVGSLTHRLMSEPLDSDDENQSEMNSVLEIEGRQGNGQYHNQHSLDLQVSSPAEPYRAPIESPQYAPITNEWTE